MTLQQLIDFYEAIPAELWCQKQRRNGPKRCALQHVIDAATPQVEGWVNVSASVPTLPVTCSELVNANDNAKPGKEKEAVLTFLRSKL